MCMAQRRLDASIVYSSRNAKRIPMRSCVLLRDERGGLRRPRLAASLLTIAQEGHGRHERECSASAFTTRDPP